MRFVLLALSVFLVGCAGTSSQNVARFSLQENTVSPAGGQIGSYDKTIAQIIKVATAMCHAEAKPNSNIECKFAVSFGPIRSGVPAASSQIDNLGHTTISINQAMLNRTSNFDQLAFVIAHEAAHTIAGHHSAFLTTRSQTGFTVGKTGGRPQIELEADALATVISRKAGFNPMKGVLILNHLGSHVIKASRTHPTAAARLAIVKRTDQLIQKGWHIEID